MVLSGPMAQGFIIWFTGLSGSGKSTLAAKVSERLREEGVHVEALDGDEVRKHLSWGLGFSREDRDRNVRRIGYVARLVARSGACAVTAAISPFRAIRDEIRNQTDRFCEVYCECPIEVLAERDPKGLYKKALAGEIKDFTGVTAPYEAPENPEIHLRTDLTSEAECLEIILRSLREMGYLETAAGRLSMPEPYAGELLQVPARAFEAGPDAPVIELDSLSHDETLALCAGYLSPVSGFMPAREAEKVVSLGHLEQGFPWPTPQLLRVPAALLTIPQGTAVILRSGEEDVAELHLQETFEREGRAYAAGILQAVSGSAQLSVSARELRQRAQAAGLRYFCLVMGREAPPTDAARLLQVIGEACDGVVLLAAAEHLPAWQALAGSGLTAELPAYLVAHPEFDQIVGRNVGASRVIGSLVD